MLHEYIGLAAHAGLLAAQTARLGSLLPRAARRFAILGVLFEAREPREVEGVLSHLVVEQNGGWPEDGAFLPLVE